MLIKTHHSMSIDGFSATPEGRPAITLVTHFAPKESHGIPEFTGGPDALLERLRSDEFEGDAEVLGGPTLIRDFWQRGAIDQLGLLVLPILMGEGLPLLPLADGR